MLFIDRDQIYVAGCSNGGYMSMKLTAVSPTLFAASVPICGIVTDRCHPAPSVRRGRRDRQGQERPSGVRHRRRRSPRRAPCALQAVKAKKLRIFAATFSRSRTTQCCPARWSGQSNR
ncbi:prolyl oligopeptidase family serine peptidase [Streptomyces sp. A2-16]|uniref:prolyl oligopeptidase family serine peptidase n=1 Tax=Streptomyces sp. A2-16 TaxID=2781734 RepID=UPI001BAEF420|nr:prolyl oligopeptidase family serine peptidase [Streptomyces sp. A2-16]QUC58917.1 prolyl oligopeptidase family serine peptidase [Streptomyces sp. A2-16]